MSATGFSAKEAKMLREKAETHQFQVLHQCLITSSLTTELVCLSRLLHARLR